MRLKINLKQFNPTQLLVGLSTVVFIGVYFLGERDLLVATKWLFYTMILAFVAGLIFYKNTRSKDWILILGTLFFSGLTVYFDNQTFIKWRPTMINLALATTLIMLYFWKKKPFKHILEKPLDLTLSDNMWVKVNLIWAVYLLCNGALNALVVLLNVSDEFWMNYKTFVSPVITFVFLIVLFVYLHKKSKQNAE